MSSRTTSSAWIKGIADMFDSLELDTGRILETAGIDPAELTDADHRTPTDKVSRLWRAAVEISGDDNIGVAQAHVPKPGNFDIVAYTMLSSPTLDAAIRNFARHLRLVSDAAEIALDEAAGDDLVCLKLRLIGGDEAIPRQRIEFDLLTIATFCRWVSRRPLRLARVFFRAPPPLRLEHFKRAFDCPLAFLAPFDGIAFHRHDLEARLPSYNERLAEAHDRLAQSRLAALDGYSVSQRASHEIARRLADGEPRRERIAEALNLSDRALASRLRAEGTSFQQALDSTRRDLARQHLAETRLSLAEVAYLLGFSNQSAFFRASRRWFDASPRKVRSGGPARTTARELPADEARPED